MLALNILLGLNALSCLIFGTLFTTKTKNVAQALGSDPLLPPLVFVSGVVLLIFSAHLITAILRKNKIKGEVYYFSLGDSLWVMGSIALLMGTKIISETTGVYYTIAVALMVAIFAVGQLILGKSLPENTIQNRMVVNTSKEKAWKVLADFSNISQYHPLVLKSEASSESNEGLGARRHCTFRDGGQVDEEVLWWQEGVGYSVSIEGMPVPVKDFENRIELKSENGQTQLSITTKFRGAGFFSEIFLGFLLKPVLRRKMAKVLEGFAEAVT